MADSRVVSLGVADGVGDAVDYCARPKCRKEFRRQLGPGRRREYCSDECRRTAETEYKRTKAMLRRHEQLVAKFRADLAAFGRDEDGPESAEAVDVQVALARAEGILDYADPGERLYDELHRATVALKSLSSGLSQAS